MLGQKGTGLRGHAGDGGKRIQCSSVSLIGSPAQLSSAHAPVCDERRACPLQHLCPSLVTV